MKATFTQFDTYHTCPYQYYRLYKAKGNEKVKRSTSDALDKGIRVHDGIEKWFNNEAEALPSEVHPSWTDFMDYLKKLPVETETRLDNDIAYGKLDLYVASELTVDWKTGKPRVNDAFKREQLRFYAWLAGESIQATLAWVEHDFKKSKVTININYTPILDRVWRTRIEKMQNDSTHKKEPNWKCNYCPVEDCEFFKNWKSK